LIDLTAMLIELANIDWHARWSSRNIHDTKDTSIVDNFQEFASGMMKEFIRILTTARLRQEMVLTDEFGAFKNNSSSLGSVERFDHTKTKITAKTVRLGPIGQSRGACRSHALGLNIFLSDFR
jgi:hypothetical protein